MLTTAHRAMHAYRLLWFLTLLAGCDAPRPLAPVAHVATTRSSHPNFVFVLVDDQEISTAASMPTLQAEIAAKGATFTNAFVTTSWCCPSRTSILRGQYTHNHDVWTVAGPVGGYDRVHELGLENSTLATWLRDAGYATALVGKYLNEYQSSDAVPPGWDTFYPKQTFVTSRLDSVAVDFIGRATAPFFLYLAPHAPHYPATPPNAYAGTMAGAHAPRPPSFLVNDGKPAAAYQVIEQDFGADSLDALYERHLECMRAVDDMLAHVIAALRQRGELANTYIVYMSDNGLLFGQHALGATKNLPYEESVRVPLFVRGPGIAAGQIFRDLVLNIDIAPTITKLAHVQHPPFVDGRSLSPLLLGGAYEPRLAFAIEHKLNLTGGPPTEESQLTPVFAFRTRRYKYIEWGTGEREFYDLRADPYEMSNSYAALPAETQSLLAHRLRRLMHCAGQGCDDAERNAARGLAR